MNALFRWLLESSTGLWILAGGCALIGLHLCLSGLHFLRKGWSSTHWPVTEGQILTSVLREVGSGKRMSYLAEIVYAYQVDGNEHTASRVFWGDSSFLGTSESFLQERLADDYRQGQRVQIHYNPAHPQEAVLEPGSSFRIYVVFLGGICMLSGAVFAGLMALGN